MLEKIKYNWIEIWTTWKILFGTSDDDNNAWLNLQDYELPRSDGKWFLNANYSNKYIRIQGWITAENEKELSGIIDDFKYRITAKEEELELQYRDNEGKIREMVAKAIVNNQNNIFSRQHFHLTRIDFEIEFNILKWYLTDKEYTEINKNFTSDGEFTESEIWYEWQMDDEPTFSISINSASDVAFIRIRANWKTFLLRDENMSDGDEYTVDAETQNVFKNWEWFKFFGEFVWIWRNTSVDVDFFDNEGESASGDIDIDLKYKNRWK